MIKKTSGLSAKLNRRRPRENARILDAAEAVFVQRGYFGTSLRNIATAARVPTASLSIQFTSKEDLFRAVIKRRAPDLAADIHGRLTNVATTKKGKAKLEAILKAVMQPIVDRSMRGGVGWKNYIRLVAQTANLPHHQRFVTALPENYDELIQSVLDAVEGVYPRMPQADLHWSLHFFLAALTYVLCESGFIDWQSNEICRASDLDVIVPKLVSYCVAGIDAIAKSP